MSGMNFSKAMKAATSDERDSLIEKELLAYMWEDELADEMQHGGWPEEAQITNFEIDDSGDDDIVVTVRIDFNEAVYGGCGDMSVNYGGDALFVLSISRDGGSYDLENQSIDITDDDEYAEGDFY